MKDTKEAKGARCSICNLDAKPRKIGESLLTLGIGVRDVADFTNWYLDRYPQYKREGFKYERNAWSRHRVGGHFESQPRKVEDSEGNPLDLDALVDDLFIAWQKANKGITPSAREVREWLKLRASIRSDIERREGAQQLDDLLMNAGHKEEEYAIRPTGTEGNQQEVGEG